MLPVTEYGNIEVIEPLPTDLVHIDARNVSATCKRLGIEYARAVVGFRGDYRYGHSPQFRGVVIRAIDEERLRGALAARKPRKPRPTPDILTALFTLNRRAKRCRDLAQRHYWRGQHGLAGTMRREKDSIYWSKGQALHHLLADGRLAGGQYHRFDGGNYAELLTGGGYTFHRPCPPPEDRANEAVEIGDIETKSKGAKEPTLAAARQVVADYLADKPLDLKPACPERGVAA